MPRKPSDISKKEFFAALPLSSAVQDHFKIYHDVLMKWQKKINLISTKTVDDIWERHFLDSGQLYKFIPDPENNIIVDLGSGAGFPALILSIMGCRHVSAVEVDNRKCIFMSEISRLTSAPIKIINQKIEAVRDIEADIITARALAPVVDLIRLGLPLLKQDGVFLLLKGENWEAEIKEAEKYYKFSVESHSSATEAKSRILKLFHVEQL